MKNERKRIFIVDDEPAITRLLKANLEETNFYIVHAENVATKALAAAEAFGPDLVLMDVMMPGTDGSDLASCFQANRKLKDVPLVFLTAAVKREEISAGGGRIGGLPFLAKPVDVSEVLGCLQSFLGPCDAGERDLAHVTPDK
jgi:two-component system, OmpR family, response regulator